MQRLGQDKKNGVGQFNKVKQLLQKGKEAVISV
jgi:hypothetical protein